MTRTRDELKQELKRLNAKAASLHARRPRNWKTDHRRTVEAGLAVQRQLDKLDRKGT